MAIPVTKALSAYQSMAQLAPKPELLSLNLAGNGEGAAPDFGALVEAAVNNVTTLGKDAQSQSVKAVEGKADMVDVVTALSQAELAMNTMVTVRDRVIAAYEEIMRMPI